MRIHEFNLVPLFLVILSADLPHFSAIASGPPTSVTIVTCCDWNGDYRLNLLPHPTNCEAYYHCETKLFQDGRYGTTPTSKDCPLDEKGNRLHFDFLECRCLRNNEAVCYDGSLSGHFSGFFNCTQPFSESGVNIKCTR